MDFRRIYVDDTLEKELNEIVLNECDFSHAIEENNTYEYHYFLSHLRQNLFNWYPFKKEGSLLEIGASYGQLTELFTKKVKHVVCVEDNESKVEIISKRAKEAKVIISDFNNIDTDEKFDYIILCNIFEYAKQFQESKNPYEDYLTYLMNFLKKDGVILISISNRLGLNYFAGFKEEHTDLYFSGINGFANINYVETFSRTELEDLLVSSGFTNYKFFYPYPNHEFPLIINTDKYVNKIPFERRLDYFDSRYDLFREDVLNQILAKDELAGYFSNSFLVEIRNSEIEYPTDSIDFVKLNSDRVEEFRTITTIKSDGFVYKSALSPESNNHIINMFKESRFKLGKIAYLDCEYIDNSIKYKLLEEESLENRILNSILDDNKEEFYKLMENYYDALFYGSFQSNNYADGRFLKVFKRGSNVTFHCHEKSNLDLIFSNIFIIDDEYVAIDYEWIFDFQIPLEYIFYRCLLHYTKTNNVFKEFVSIEEIFNYFNLDSSNFGLFRIWDHNFMDYVFSYLPKPQRSIMSRDGFGNVDEEFEDYVDIYLDSDEIDENELELLKHDMVINQREIILKKINHINHLNKQINAKNKQINTLNNKIRLRNNALNITNRKIREYENSNSWKITSPIRKFNHLLHKKRGE